MEQTKKTMNAILDESSELLNLFNELESKTEGMSAIDKDEEMQVLADWVGQTDSEFKRKVDSYIAVIREFDGMALVAKDEAKRMQLRVKHFENKAEQLKDYLRYAMERIGIDKCKTAFNTVSIANNGGKAPLQVDESELPAQWFRITKSADKAKIYEALNEGVEINGAKILERGKSLRIK